MSDIAFNVRARSVVEEGVGGIRIGLPTSTKDQLTNNELLNILNTLKRSHYLDPATASGFPYSFGDFIFGF